MVEITLKIRIDSSKKESQPEKEFQQLVDVLTALKAAAEKSQKE